MLKLNRARLLWTVGVLSSLPLSAHATVDAVARWKIYDSGSSPDTCSVVHDIQTSYNGTPVGCSASTNFSSDNPRNSNNGTSYDLHGTSYIMGGMYGMLAADNTTYGYDGYTGSRTITAWVKVGTLPNDGKDKAVAYLGRDSGGGGSACSGSPGACSGFHLVVGHDGSVIFGTAQGGAIISSLSTCSSIEGNSWHFLVGVYSQDDNNDNDGDDTYIYIDNVLCGHGNMATVPNTYVGADSKFSIGTVVNPSSNGEHDSGSRFGGKVDDARVFDRTMGSVERTALWNAGGNGGAD